MKGFEKVGFDFDGIYCPICREMHPTLYWHDKYSEYMEQESWIQSYQKAIQRFKLVRTYEECREAFIDQLRSLGLSIDNVLGSCVICGADIPFRHRVTGHYLCSDKCKYSDWRVYGYTISNIADLSVFRDVCVRLEQHNIFPEGDLLNDVDGTLIQDFTFHCYKIRVQSDTKIDAVYVDSQIDLGEALEGMILRDYTH